MKIVALNHANLNLINKINSAFVVDSKLKVNLSGNKFTYETEPLAPYEKSYNTMIQITQST